MTTLGRRGGVSVSALDRALDVLAAAPADDAAYAPPGTDDPSVCWRCLGPAGTGPSGVCGECRTVLLGDGPIEPATHKGFYARGIPAVDLPGGSTIATSTPWRAGEYVQITMGGVAQVYEVEVAVDGCWFGLRAVPDPAVRETLGVGAGTGRYRAQTRAARRARAYGRRNEAR